MKIRTAFKWLSLAGLLPILLIASQLPSMPPAMAANETATTTVTTSDCSKALKYPLPLPSTLKQTALQNYDVTLYDFLNCGNYTNLGWARDKSVRNTGPFVLGEPYGTHPAVRIYYSPQVIQWLKQGKKGAIPDGAMIIKEQYKAPAARYDNLDQAGLLKAFIASGKDWTVMIRDSKGSKDGWYWAEVYTGMSPDRTVAWQAPYNYPNGGFGHYCMRCHGSARNEHTFADLKNIAGFPGDPLTFYSDNSWITPVPTATPTAIPTAAPAGVSASAASTPNHTAATDSANSTTGGHGHRNRPRSGQRSIVKLDDSFLSTFNMIPAVPLSSVQMMVGETFDRTVSAHKGAKGFVSSDQCLLCHGGLSGSNPIMYLPLPASVNAVNAANAANQVAADKGLNVSPYGEWRWSPMGLAGRDPVFYAQLESELAFIDAQPNKQTAKSLRDTTINTCFRCHGVMGKRQWDTDHHCEPSNPVKPCNPADPKRPQFQPEFTQITDSANPNFKYGALARDGISCLSCHRQQPTKQPPGSHQNELKYFLENSITGLFQTMPPDKLAGPFKDVATLPMDNTLGIKPIHSDYIKESRMCGSCHTIYLPIIDKPTVQPVGPKTEYNMEQATYLEWLNSSFQTEWAPAVACNTADPQAPCARSCQSCHMPGNYHNAKQELAVSPIKTKIATVQDQNFPAAEGLAPAKKIHIPIRNEGYARHELLGMNVFLLEMAKQFNTIMGLRSSDYMTGNKYDIDQTISNLSQQASERTARVQTSIVSSSAKELVVDVSVTNLAGHRLPSGVGFRRAFIELSVLDNSNGKERTVWASGRSNDLGVILDGNGKPLPSEFFESYIGKDGKKQQHFQPHYQTITRQDQVQIYEELVRDGDAKFTTSFLRRDEEVKDNRLLPAGWTKAGPDPKNFGGVYLHATWPKGDALNDPDYANGSGGDKIRYQISLPAGLNPAHLSVRATLYYQSIPPYFLAQRFAGAPNGPATQRLHYMTANLDLSKSPAKGWKMPIASSLQKVQK
jgi:cytochrome c553